MAYTKLFASIVHSTIWQESKDTKLLWVTMLALADRDGIVEASVPGLASAAGLSISECEKALAVLSAPDPYSRTQTEEGRRIRHVDGGWFVINHPVYRERASIEEGRAKAAIRQKRQRERKRDASQQVTAVTKSHDKAEASPSPSPEADQKESPSEIRKSSPVRQAPTPKVAAKQIRKRPAMPLPENWKPSAAHCSIAASEGANLAREEQKFRDYAEANGKLYASWDAAFRTWLRNASEFRRNGGAKPPGMQLHEQFSYEAPDSPEFKAAMKRAKEWRERQERQGQSGNG